MQERVGRNGKPFGVYKFRTMIVDSESKGLKITVGNDPRITSSGLFLRRTKLDELAQLFNVLGGSMSLVGPRPEVKEYINAYPGSRYSRDADWAPGEWGPTKLEDHEELRKYFNLPENKGKNEELKLN